MDTQILSEIETSLKNNSNILFAYLFGSKVKKNSRFGSDLDLAVYFCNEPEILEMGALVLQLEEIANCNADLVSLNNLDKLNPKLAYSIISEGIVVCLNNKKLFNQFKESVVLKYLDFKTVDELFNKNFNHRLANHKFAVTDK
jgi:predicted nucleotidyltransferase